MIEPTLVMVVCNEGHRLEALLEHLRPYFSQIVIGVQDSDDDTRDIVKRYADRFVDDKRWGYGDASMPLIQRRVASSWCFRVDGDEWPIPPLLESLPDAVAHAEKVRLDGLWIPFRSWIERVEWDRAHSHLRLWRNKVKWPSTLHSRPMTSNTEFWKTGYIYHQKTLDEHVRGYLEYLRVSGNNRNWIDHNVAMIEAACSGVAAERGWDYVEGHDWWPQVSERVFHGQDPRHRLTEMAVAEP